MTIAIPVFALMLYLGKQAKNRKRDNTQYDEVKKDIKYVIRKIFCVSTIFAAIAYIAIVASSYVVYNKIILNSEYLIIWIPMLYISYIRLRRNHTNF